MLLYSSAASDVYKGQLCAVRAAWTSGDEHEAVVALAALAPSVCHAMRRAA